VVTTMINAPVAQAGTALSPEWDRGFDEAFTELISGDDDLVRAEFDALIGATWQEPPAPPAPPAPTAEPPDRPSDPSPAGNPAATPDDATPAAATDNQRSPPGRP
jgi:hypothetical protein